MKKLIIANWKMNPQGSQDARRLANKIWRGVQKFRNIEVALAPPFIHLPLIFNLKPPTSDIKLCAQDAFYEKSGAYTGEISTSQLKSYGVKLIIVGHSERRALGETDDIVNKKLKAVFAGGMRALLCVGEKEKIKDEAFPTVIRDEIHFGLKKIKKSLLKNLIIAYEPIWAIGAGKADAPKDIYEMTLMIRRELCRMLGRNIALRVPILYGGSVDERNVVALLKHGGVDGFLVGGASLNHKKFVKMVKEASSI